MEKVKITVEQEEALGFYVKSIDETNFFRLKYFIDKKDQFVSDFKSLKNFNAEEFSLLLNGWYEVEKPKLKVGDWVFDTLSEIYRKVTNEKSEEVRCVYVNTANALQKFEKVTEQWKIVLLEVGRNKPVLKFGDMFLTENESFLTVTELNITHASKLFEKAKYFHPIESRIEMGNNK